MISNQVEGPAWEPLEMAMSQYLKGDRTAKVKVHNSFGDTEYLWMQYFFRAPEAFSILEHKALALAHGRVLDVGAGSGSFSLWFQGHGFDVVALDIAEGAVAAMQQRGINDTRCGDYFEFEDESRFDTLFLMMNGIGIACDQSGLYRFFEHAHRLLRPGGCIILDSSDLHVQSEEGLFHLQTRAVPDDLYGSVLYQLHYGACRGKAYRWLFADPELLRTVALECGFLATVVVEEQNSHYLAYCRAFT